MASVMSAPRFSFLGWLQYIRFRANAWWCRVRERAIENPPPNVVLWVASACTVSVNAQSMCTLSITVDITPLPGAPLELEQKRYGPFDVVDVFHTPLVERCCWAYLMENPSMGFPSR